MFRISIVRCFIALFSANVLLFWFVGLLIVLLAGICFVKICGLKESIELFYIAGCIFSISLSHITASIAELFGISFELFRVGFIMVYGIILLWMIFYLYKKKRIGSVRKFAAVHIAKVKGYSWIDKILLVVVLGLFGYVFINSMARGFYGGDDGYYVTKIGMMIRDNTLHITNSQAANGLIDDPSFIRADASTWCAFLALIGASFYIDYAITAHVAIVPFILFAFFAVILLFAKSLFKKTTDQMLFALFFLLLALTTPHAHTMTVDNWIFSYTWYGISAMYIIMYFLIYCILLLWKEPERLSDIKFWFFVALSIMAAEATEVVAVFVIPCLIFMFGVPYLMENKDRLSKKVICNVAIALLPVMQAALSVLLQYNSMSDLALNGGENGGFNVALTSLAGWKQTQSVFWKFTSENPYTCITVLCLFLIADPKIRKFFTWSFLVAVFTFLNPFFYKFICMHISTEIVYYRLYWCIPNLIIIAYCVVEWMIKLSSDKCKAALLCSMCVLYLITYRNSVYTQFRIAPNLKKCSPEIAAIAQDLLDMRTDGNEIYAVVPDNLCNFIRQYSLDIVYPVGKRSSDYAIIPNSDMTYLGLYQKIYQTNSSEEVSSEPLTTEDVAILSKLGTQVIVFPQDVAVPDVLQSYTTISKDGYLFIALAD